jgi:hypothetical protein
MATSAYEKARRLKSTVSKLPSRAVTAFLSAGSSSLSISAATEASKPVPAAESPFFRLPLELRETIYGLVVGRREMLHIMMMRRLPNRLIPPLVHRRCPAGGNLEECILHDCKRFLLEGGKGVYYGSFNNIGGLLFSCRDM